MKDQSRKDVRKLRQPFHTLSTQNQLFHDETEGLREAVAVKKNLRSMVSLSIFNIVRSITVEWWSGHQGRSERHVLVTL